MRRTTLVLTVLLTLTLPTAVSASAGGSGRTHSRWEHRVRMLQVTGKVVFRRARPDAVQIRVALRGRLSFRVVRLWLKGTLTWRDFRHRRRLVRFRLHDGRDRGRSRVHWTSSFRHRVGDPERVSFSGLLFLYAAGRSVKHLGSAVEAAREPLGKVSLVLR